MPVGIQYATHHRVVLFDREFPAAKRRLSDDEAPAMSCVRKLCIEHHEVRLRIGFRTDLYPTTPHPDVNTVYIDRGSAANHRNTLTNHADRLDDLFRSCDLR